VFGATMEQTNGNDEEMNDNDEENEWQ